MLGSPLTRAGLPTALPPQQQRMLADMVENNAQVRLPNTAPQHNTTTAHHPWQPPQAFTQISGLDTLRQRVREYAFKREETRKRLRQTSHPQFAHSPQLAAPSFNPAAFGMPLPKQRPPLARVCVSAPSSHVCGRRDGSGFQDSDCRAYARTGRGKSGAALAGEAAASLHDEACSDANRTCDFRARPRGLELGRPDDDIRLARCSRGRAGGLAAARCGLFSTGRAAR